MCNQSKCNHESGFTILELLLVLVILAVVSTIAYPLIHQSHRDMTLRSTAHQLANHLRLARGAAIKSNKDYTMTIDVAQRRYWVNGLTRPRRISQAIAVDFITLLKERSSSKRAGLRFYPDGSATGGKIILTMGRNQAIVELDWLTGNTRVRWSK